MQYKFYKLIEQKYWFHDGIACPKIKSASLQKLLLVFYYIIFLLLGVLFGVPVTLIYTARGIFWQWKNSGLIYGFKEIAITFRLHQSIDRKRPSASQVTLV